MGVITEGKRQKQDTVDYRPEAKILLLSTCRLFPDSIIRLLHTDIHRTPENSEQIGNTDSSELLSLDHEQKPRRSFCKLTVDRRKCVYYTLACALSQTGIRYRVRHLDIISDDRDAATGGEGGRATGGPFLPREGAAHTSSRDKDGRNSSCDETIVREQGEGERKTGPTCSFASAAAATAAAAAAAAEEEEEEEEEQKTRNTLACSKRKEKIKFKGEEREEGERMEQKERNNPLVGSKRKGRDVEKDGERARVRSGRN
ncbi:hypothetical protein ALC60_06589 [Trachymyrmex zeteki]|uniref:Uncharacterized protein n=1 Tax=Mycetomoellerius zeteki TaxID=64791 RepID=A0A151X2A3_9HYME|nr:hypothetical protein ALC60_06589 [Trachymyrmex zeteki]